MPTQDEFVSVPLNTGLSLKRDDFTAEAPGLRRCENVNNEGEIGSLKKLPRMVDTANGVTADTILGLLTGRDNVVVTRGVGDVLSLRKEGWNTGRTTTRHQSYELEGTQPIVATSNINYIAEGAYVDTNEIDVRWWCWLQVDENNVEGASGKYVLQRDGDTILGPFNLPVQDTLVRFHGVCAITTTASLGRSYGFVAEEGTVTNGIYLYWLRDNGSPQLAATVETGFAGPVSIDCVSRTGDDSDFLLVVCDTVSVRMYSVVPFGAVTLLHTHAISFNGNGLGACIDTNGSTVVFAGTGNALWVTHWTEPAGPAVDTEQAVNQFPATCTVRWASDGASSGTETPSWMGACAGRKPQLQAEDEREITSLWTVDDSNGAVTRLTDSGLTNMRLVGDAYVDEHGNCILPLSRTLGNLSGALTGAAAVWPLDPAVCGYQYTLHSRVAGQDYSVHPVAQWGSDRVRSNWGRSKSSMPYAADPTTNGQLYGRTLMSTRVHQRKGTNQSTLGTGGSLIAGGIANLFDGRNFMPACNQWIPEIDSVVENGPGGTPAGTYSVKAVFVWEDDTGILIRSGDSPPVGIVAGVDTAIRVTVSAHTPPHADDAVPVRLRLWLYVTEDGGTNYYLVPNVDTGGPAEVMLATESTVFVLDLDNLAGDPAQPLLTFAATPPEIAPRSPNGFLHTANAHNRVWGIDGEDRNRVWFSKRMQRFDAPEFSSLLVVDFPEEDGALEAIGVVNGNPIFFKRHSIWALQGGEGPGNVVGFGRGYARPVKVGFSGTNNWRSLQTVPEGIVFHTGTTFMLLGTGLQLQPIGDEVEILGHGGVIASQHLPARNELHYSTRDVDGNPHHLVRNNDIGAWVEWPDEDFIFLDGGISSDSRVFLLDRPSGLQNLQVIQLKETGEDPDWGSAVRPLPDQVVQTPWIRPGDRNAARRVRELVFEFAKTEAPASGTLTIDVDEEQGQLKETRTWTAAEIATAYPSVDAERVILRIVPTQQFESVSVTLTVPPELNLEPVSVGVLFGIEQGIQRRYPEGSSK